jgi:hypothetical protein
MGLAATQHEATQGFFPSGGWGWSWVGDPDRGFGHRQPGGWVYNILPYMEQQQLHDLGKGLGSSNSAKMATTTTLIQTPLAVMNCPTRRRSVLYPNVWGGGPNMPYCGNLGAISAPSGANVVARADYAVSSGSQAADQYFPGPGTLDSGDASGFAWTSTASLNGVSFQQSEVKAASITDGLTNTIFCGEKYLGPDWYTTGTDPADNENMYVGFDNDMFRSTDTAPMRDTAGLSSGTSFGSAHSAGCQFVMCDGSTRYISYSVNPNVFALLGSKNDNQVIDPSKL